MSDDCTPTHYGDKAGPLPSWSPLPWWRKGDIPSTCLFAAYAPDAAADLAASYVNLASPGVHDATPLVVPGLVVGTGWTFNGAQYLDTGFIPAIDQSQSMLIQFSDVTAPLGNGHYALAGAGPGVGDNNFDLSNWWNINVGWSKTDMANGGHNYNVDGSWLADGNMGVAGSKQYVNGLPNGITMSAWVGASTLSVYIGAKHTALGYQWPLYAKIQKVIIYSCILTDAQMLAVATAMAA